MTQQIDFSVPRRQSLLGVVVYFVKNGRALVSALIVLWATAGKFDNGNLYLTLGLIVFVILVFTISYLQYRNFTFHIDGDEVVIHHGVIVKEKRIIPFDRIQSVNLNQNFIQQILQVVGLKIDSAGSQQKELEISALDERTARAFQAALQQRPVQAGDDSTSTEPLTAKKTLLLKLDVGDLLKVGLTENHLRSGLLAVAVVFGYYSQFSEYLEDYMSEYVSTDLTEYIPEIVRMGLILVVTGILIFSLISVILSLVRTFLRFFEFRAWLEEDIIGISSGLLKRVEYRIPVSKVQYLIWSTNPLRKILGFESIVVKQAQPQRAQRKPQQAIAIPACYDKQSRALENVVFSREIDAGSKQFSANIIPYVLISTYVAIAATLIVLFITAITSAVFWPAVLLIPTIIFFGYKYGKSVSVDWQEDVLIIHKGWVFPKRYVIPVYKAQSVAFKQSIFLKRRSLANFVFYTASGKVMVRFLPQELVINLYNFILYKTEDYKGSWM